MISIQSGCILFFFLHTRPICFKNRKITNQLMLQLNHIFYIEILFILLLDCCLLCFYIICIIQYIHSDNTMGKEKGKLLIQGLDQQQQVQVNQKERKKQQKKNLLEEISQSNQLRNKKQQKQKNQKHQHKQKHQQTKTHKKYLNQQKRQDDEQKERQDKKDKKIKKNKQHKNKNKKHRKNDLSSEGQNKQFQQIQEAIQQQEKQSLNQSAQNQDNTQVIKLKHLAIAIPDSILQIPQTSQLRAYFISQIARISSIFKVDEIIILKDHSYVSKSENFNPAQYMARNLQYLQTPQYLRKHLFKLHADLKNAGLMNPIECQHHLKTDEPCEYREGVALDRPTKKDSGSWVDIGLKQQARMNHLVLPLTRVTLKLQNFQDPDAPFYQAEAVSKRTPRNQKGLYWGYDVRIAKNLKDMMNASKSLSGSSQQTQYDIKVLVNHTKQTYSLPQVQNFYQISQQLADCSMVIFFSGTDDLSTFIEKDSKSKISKQQEVQMFDCCMRLQGFGVKNLRIEEQLFITLSKICDFT